MSGNVILLLGVLAVLGTFVSIVGVRRPAALSFPVMMTSWLVGELAVFHLVLQLVVLVVAVVSGALGHTAGRVGAGLLLASVVGLAVAHWRASRSPVVLAHALESAFGPGFDRALDRDAIAAPPARSAWSPFRFDRRGVEIVRDVRYSEAARNVCDVYRPAGPVGAGRPVLLFVHGGAWVIGDKRQQGQPMLLHLARRGFVCVSINYRLAPRHRWPAAIVDVKRAIVWIRTHIAAYGGDPSFLAAAGASAGGHLVALAALTPGERSWQPGFEDADTSLDACVPIYAPFDLTDHFGIRGRASMRRFLERLVMPTRLRDDLAGWQAASPLFRIGPDAPPMLVVQGSIDVLVWPEDTRRFVAALRAVSRAPVVAVELPGAQHAFDVFNSVRSRATVDGIARFLATVRQGVSDAPG